MTSSKQQAPTIPSDAGHGPDWRLARGLVEPLYRGHPLATGEERLAHADGMAAILRDIRDDDELLCAAYLFSVGEYLQDADDWIEKTFGPGVARLVDDLRKLSRVSLRARDAGDASQQSDILRRMLLAMCRDLRVVVLRLASRLQTMRWFAASGNPGGAACGRETLALYSPLANRLGIWQMKWELEDLGLRLTEPAVYEEITRELDESREQRLRFMEDCVERIRVLLREESIPAEVSGRPKHIYSIYRKMKRKQLRLEQLFDIRAVRVIVASVEQCYQALSVVQKHFTVLGDEFDDYIAHPKPNGYQSLHTVISDLSGKPVEIQIRTRQMHESAELGVAAHWRYKETGGSARGQGSDEERRVAWLRQILAWRSDVDPTVSGGVADDRVYALTPQGRVVELQAGSTPIDFAYQVHTELGHRCRGAKVDGVMVALNTPLQTGQTVEIIAAKVGGPSRDWLNSELGYAVSPRTRTKVRQWFNARALSEQISTGRERLERELARLGKTAVKLDELAKRLSFDTVDELCVAVAKEEISPRALEQALSPRPAEGTAEPDVVLRAAKRDGKDNVLVVGMGSLMTQLARCCHPAPPDEIIGFVTRGRGVTVHSINCPNVRNLAANDQERMIEVSWGQSADAVYPVDVLVIARDRVGLIKDISEIFLRERQNLIGMNTMNVRGDAHMRLTVEIHDSTELEQSLRSIRLLPGVMSARRC